MKFSFSYKPYKRLFRNSLRTARGLWSDREGILLKVESSDQVALGEIAPIPEFGSETLDSALSFIDSLEIKSLEALSSLEIPSSLPCCAFAFSSILRQCTPTERSFSDACLPVAGLLPSGKAMGAVLAEKKNLGFTTFKWKIGVEPLDLEFEMLKSAIDQLSDGEGFRLDANGSLSVMDLDNWLRLCQTFNDKIEFFEQPLAVGQESEMALLSKKYGIPIALDESLNGPEAEAWMVPGAWAGPLVIKPCLLGSIRTQLECYKKIAHQLVVSSAFESSVGLNECLGIALSLEDLRYALGVDTQSAFNDSYGVGISSPNIDYKKIVAHTKELIENEF